MLIMVEQKMAKKAEHSFMMEGPLKNGSRGKVVREIGRDEL